MVRQAKAFFDAFDKRHKKTASRSRWRLKYRILSLKHALLWKSAQAFAS
jgi:hypothetical protein